MPNSPSTPSPGSPVRVYLQRHLDEAQVELEHAETHLEHAERDHRTATDRVQTILDALGHLDELEAERVNLRRLVVGPPLDPAAGDPHRS